MVGASTDLANSVWIPVGTNTLTGGLSVSTRRFQETGEARSALIVGMRFQTGAARYWAATF